MLDLDQKYRPSYFRNKNRGTGHYAETLASAIMAVFNPLSVIDLGCGSGTVLAQLQQQDIPIFGVEGTENCYGALQIDRRMVWIADLRTVLLLPMRFDLAISFEVAEHLEPEFANTFVDNLCRVSDRVLMSAAPPAQDGWGHVNCQPRAYWKRRFVDRGYIYNWSQVASFREKLAPIDDRDDHRVRAIQSNVMYFEREPRRWIGGELI